METERKKNSYHHGALRGALLEAALTTIERDGLESLSLRGLAASLGVSKTAPFRHFANKQALLTSMAAEGFRTLADELERAEATQSAQGGGPTGSLAALGTAYIEFALARPALYRLMFSRLGYALESEACRINSGRAFGVLVRTVQSRMNAGWQEAKDAEALTLSVWALVHGWSGLLIDDLVPTEIPGITARWREMVGTLLG